MAAGGTALLWLVIVVAAVSSGGDNGSTDDQVNETTATHKPDTTELATPTQTEVTDTPTLTPTAEPTLPQLTAAECSYTSEVGQQASDYGTALGGLADVVGRSDLFTEEWILALAVQLVFLDLIADEAIALDGPSSLDDVQDEWVAVGLKVKQVVDLMTEGVDEIDADKIERAALLMIEISDDVPGVTALVLDFAELHSGTC